MSDIKTLTAERTLKANEFTALHNIDLANRTTEEDARLSQIMEEIDALDAKIETATKAAKMNARLEEAQRDIPQSASGITAKTAEEIVGLKMKAFNEGLRHGTSNAEYVSTLKELKNLNATVDDQGGYITAPQEWVNTLLKDVDDTVDIRRLATVIRVNRNESIGVPSLDTDLDDAEWTVELATGSLDTAMRIGKRELQPHPFAKRIKLSKTLIRSSVMDVDALIRARIAYKAAVTEEKAFLTGDGDKKPLGLFVASTDGIGTGRDITGTGTTYITADDLMDTVYSLKPQHLREARWLLHRDWVKDIRKLKDGNGQYLWQPGLTAGQPDLILGKSFIMSEFAPNTKTTGLYVALLGDLKNYWIVDNLTLTIQVLYELYAETNQLGYIVRKEVDGAPAWDQGFARLKLA